MIEKKGNLWVLSFEYAGIAKVGGLGEVPANQVKYLSKKYNVFVILPSHGQIDRLKMDNTWEKLSINCIGSFNPQILGERESEMKYDISFYRFKINDTNFFILTGENPSTRKFLDDNDIYNPDTINGKILLFSIGVRKLMTYLVENRKEILPDVIHLHDYHVVISLINIKQILNKKGLDIASIITIHLLTWPRFPIEFYKASGVDVTPFNILLREGFKLVTIEDIFDLCLQSDYEHSQIPTVEKVGAVISDLVTTVSQSYLKSDIIPNCGKELIDFKSDFVWDGCDWDYDEINKKVKNSVSNELREFLENPAENLITKEILKEYLLKYKIGNLSQSPLISSKKVLEVINEISNGNPFIKNGNIKAFNESGPLIITTGRISPQKGFETIFEAIPKVIKVIPNVKFLFLLIPTVYNLNEIQNYSKYVKNYSENIRIIFGVASDIFYLAHMAADVYCALSRWEPFGINALEAMASKIPIIGTKVGGLQETIIDMRSYPELGTGILIEKDNVLQFADEAISLLLLAEISNRIKEKGLIYDTSTFQLVNQIPDEILKSRVLIDAHYYENVRENCYKRVKNNFRWEIVSKKLIDLYSRIKKLHLGY